MPLPVKETVLKVSYLEVAFYKSDLLTIYLSIKITFYQSNISKNNIQ